MENEVRTVIGRRAALSPALLTAAGILAVLVVQELVQTASMLSIYASSSAFGSSHTQVLASLGGTVWWFFILALPFALGVFIALWLIAPIEARHGVAQIIPRAIAAAGIGAALVFVVSAGLAIVGGMSFPGNLFGAYLPFAYDGWGVVDGFRRAAHSAISLLIVAIPLVVLAGILESMWRRRRQPA